jgi:Acetoacetate decarboxylase (ADC)
MKIDDVKARAFAMPLTSPAFPPGPYRFIDREYLIITYRTDPAALERVVPEPLTFDEPLVKYEFIRMPDSTGFGDYTESGQVIPVKFKGQEDGYSHAMFLNDGPPIYGGRELWGFPKKYAQPSLTVDKDALIGTLDYGPVRIATGTMGFKHKALDLETVRAGLSSRTTSSRSSRMSMAATASWSLSTIASKTSSSGALGPGRPHSSLSRTRLLPLPNFPCARSCRRRTLSQTSPSAWGRSLTIISRHKERYP